MLGPPHAGSGLDRPHSRLGSSRRQPARCQAATFGNPTSGRLLPPKGRPRGAHGAASGNPPSHKGAAGLPAQPHTGFAHQPKGAFKGNLIAGAFRVARRIAVARKNALFVMQNKPVFDVRKPTAASRETHGKMGSRSDPRTTVVAQKYWTFFYPPPPPQNLSKKRVKALKSRIFSRGQLFCKIQRFWWGEGRF